MPARPRQAARCRGASSRLSFALGQAPPRSKEQTRLSCPPLSCTDATTFCDITTFDTRFNIQIHPKGMDANQCASVTLLWFGLRQSGASRVCSTPLVPIKVYNSVPYLYLPCLGGKCYMIDGFISSTGGPLGKDKSRNLHHSLVTYKFGRVRQGTVFDVITSQRELTALVHHRRGHQRQPRQGSELGLLPHARSGQRGVRRSCYMHW